MPQYIFKSTAHSSFPWVLQISFHYSSGPYLTQSVIMVIEVEEGGGLPYEVVRVCSKRGLVRWEDKFPKRESTFHRFSLKQAIFLKRSP